MNAVVIPFPTHRMTLQEHRSRKAHPAFRGVCECGEQSDALPASGMCHGWHAAHLDRVDGLPKDGDA